MDHSVKMECGFCLKKDDLVDPRCLPCAHVHCLGCLVDNFSINRVVRCPLCRKVCDTSVDNLPAFDARGDKSGFCDTCARNNVNSEAVVYCTTCTSKYCAKHQQMHVELHQDHPLIAMDEYRPQATQLQLRYCSKHTEVIYSMGCRSCLTVVCAECSAEENSCTDGSAHRLMALDQLAVKLRKEIEELRCEVVEREDKLSALFKQTSRIVCEFDDETKELIQTLRKTCDDQVNAIQLKYKKLEEELLKLREKVKLDITDFMEDDVGVKWAELSKCKLQIDARLSQSHQVDIVKRFEKTRDAMKELISDELPIFELNDMATLKVKDEKRDVEVEVISPLHARVDLEHGLTTSGFLPTSMKLIHTVSVSSYCNSVYHHNGFTYVGLDSGHLHIIHQGGQVSNSFLTDQWPMALANHVEGVIVYENHIYLLIYGNPYKVSVHNLVGNHVRTWSLFHNGSTRRGFTIIDGTVIIPNCSNKTLTVYSLTGEVRKHIPCPLLTTGTTAICRADNHRVIVSNTASSKVFKVDITTGQVVWSFGHVDKPQGVAYYKGRVYATSSGTTTRIWILDGKRGELLRELSDPTPRTSSSVHDLCIWKETLVVPRCGEKKVTFYQLC